MQNLNINNNLKKGLKYKLALIGLTTTLTASMLTGCGKKDKPNYSLNTIVKALHEEDNLTEVDDRLIENKINELDKEFRQAYKKQDIEKCNEIMGKMSYYILKALVAEGYDIEYDKIKDFEIIGNFLRYYNYWAGEHYTETEYGVEFEYKGTTYRLEAEGIARVVCVIYRASQKNQLVDEDKYTDFDYLRIPEAYEYLKEALATTLDSNSKKHTNKYEEVIGADFDGYIQLKDDNEKEKAIKRALKMYEAEAKRENKSNNKLPIKR